MNDKLQEYRNKIDGIDLKILKLLNERAETAVKIGELKNSASKTVYVPSREVEVINNLLKNNPGPLEKEDILNIYKEVMSVCRAKEEKIKVSYLGPEATFSHQAALRQFGSKAEFISLPRFEDVIYEVEKSRADFAVVPIENSNEGAVSTTLDLLVDTKLNVINEINMRVSPCLLSNGNMENIKIVYSHQQPLAQCSSWLHKHLPNAKISSVGSTAEAAKLAAKNENSAAVASEIAAKIYNLNILAKSIEDSRDNWTRFFVLGKNKALRTGNDKTTIIFSIKDKVSALHDILSVFSKNKINLTKIESRPTKKKAWQYLFFLDFVGHADDKKVREVLEEVEKDCVFLKVLGSYPKAD